MPETQPYGRTDTLPPIGVRPGTPEAAILKNLIYQRRQAIINAYKKPWILAKMCRKVATFGDDVEFPEDCKTVVHKIRQVIETQVANHLKEPVQVTMESNETGEYARWYWCGPEEIFPEIQQVAASQGLLLDPMLLGGQLNGKVIREPSPLGLQQVAAYKQLSQSQPDIFDPQFICRLDDEYTAKAVQKKYDAAWKAANNNSGGDLWLRSRVYSDTVEGWQLPLIERDPQTGQYLLGFNSIEQTYVAQESEIIALAPEAGIDLYLDLDEGLAKYPQQAQAVVNNQAWVSQQAMTTPALPGAGHVPVQYRDQFLRPMLKKIVWWIRNQPNPVPMSEQEAVDGGHVQEVAPLADEMSAQPGDVSDSIQSGNVDIGAGGQSGLSQPMPDAGGKSYALPTGEPVDPSHPLWPQNVTYVIRQVTIVSDDVVEDIALKAWPDIPLLQMRNSMVIGRAWSIGEPFYSRKLQETITDVATSGAEHVQYNAHPPMEMHGDLYDWMEKEYGDAFVTPGRIIKVPGTAFKENPNGVVRAISPPPFPESSLKILDFSNEMLNDTAGRPDALSGNTPTPNASGTLVANLQAGAVEPLNFKAQDISFAMDRLTQFIVYSELNFTPLQEWSQATSIPLPLMSLVVKRAQQKPPTYRITVSSGAGAVIEKKRDRAITLNQTISPDDGTPLLDGKTARDINGLDSAAVSRRNQEAMRNRAQVMAPAGMQAQAQQQQPQPANNNGNGNGHSDRMY